MSQLAVKITLFCEPDIEKDIETALMNSGIRFTKEEIKEPVQGYCIFIPDAIWSLSVALHILESKKDVIKGNIALSDGKKYEFTDEGRKQLNELLIGAMSRKREPSATPEIFWWTPFIPEMREFMRKINSLVEWYPKASGEGKRLVTKIFVSLIASIVLGMGILTFFDKVSGDSFVFVIGMHNNRRTIVVSCGSLNACRGSASGNGYCHGKHFNKLSISNYSSNKNKNTNNSNY